MAGTPHSALVLQGGGALGAYELGAARAHAMRTYGAEAVASGDKCLGRGGGRAVARQVRSHHKTKHHH